MPSDGKSSHCLWQGELKSTVPQLALYQMDFHLMVLQILSY